MTVQITQGTEYRVRAAEDRDVSDIVLMLLEMHVENGRFSFSANNVTVAVRQCITDGAIFLLVDCENDGLAGAIALTASRVWYSTEMALSDTFFFIREQHRSLKNFRALLGQARHLAQDLSMPLVIDLNTTVATDAKERLFRLEAEQLTRSFEFRPIGGMFVHEGS